MGKADRKTSAKNRVRTGEREFFPPAVFLSLAFSLLARFFRTSTLTESLAQAKTNLESVSKGCGFDERAHWVRVVVRWVSVKTLYI